jgi:hypothetical protein
MGARVDLFVDTQGLTKKNHRESFIPFGLHLIFLLSKTQKQGKNRNWHLVLD